MYACFDHKHTHTRLGIDHHHIVPILFTSPLRGHSVWFTSAGYHTHPPIHTHTNPHINLVPAQTGPVRTTTVDPVASRSLSSRKPSETTPVVPPTHDTHDTRPPNTSMMGAACGRPTTSPQSATVPDTRAVHGMSPEEALRVYRANLTSYERSEVTQYPEVWYAGEGAKKIHAMEGMPNNCGFDDANSRYLAKKHDQIAYRYEILSGLGKGAFGDVYKALDHRTGALVALKIIRNEKRFHRQGKVEVKVLDMLRKQDADYSHCCVHMIDYFIFRNHICITFEMHHNDLYTELKAGGFVGFKHDHVRDICINTLKCLELLAVNRIVHADLKPENMLLDASGSRQVKVIDFGSSCFQHEKVHTYIQSRYYRSPEVMLGLGYTCAIDMWSLGCILVELLTGSPLFPAKNEFELITLQTELFGVPPRYLLERATRANEFFVRTATGYEPLRYTDRKGRRRVPGGRTLASACGSSDPQFIDFITRCLTWDPADRISPTEAMSHPYCTAAVRGLTKRSVSEDGLVAALLNQRTSKAGSQKSLNDSGLDSADTSEMGDDI